MRISKVSLRNFRRLENVEIDFEEGDTVFVGPNNAGKTSATAAFKLFLKGMDFTIYDFSVSRIADIDSVGRGEENAILPSMEMDLWLSIDPESEYGRISALVPNISAPLDEVGVRIQYKVKDLEKLISEYDGAFPQQGEGARTKSLSEYLSLPNNLNRHFAPIYWTLEKSGDDIVPTHMDSDEAKKTLSNLIRIDFVDAQRNIDDHEASRSTRLSQAFASYYRMNLEQPEVNEDANKVIDENNDKLNQHYKGAFQGLMEILKGLGVPSVNDRELKLVSSLTPEVALRGTTSLLYVDPNSNHELPEAYNGLGFKNLIYIAIQVSHYHLQWISTEQKRPLCQLIFIEEPEVHLHSQVQQTFITNIWKIVREVAIKAGEPDKIPQIGVSTHSAHILDAIDFEKVRYFKRCHLSTVNGAEAKTLSASKVLSLRGFIPDRHSAEGEPLDQKEVLDFLKKYLRLTHCDLFFADAAILVEGAAEKLLLPAMIKKSAPELLRKYLAVLEVGGAYANRFAGLLEFIGIPYLVITDIDAVDPKDKRKSCRADGAGAVTSNAALKFYLGNASISELSLLSEDEVKLPEDKGYIAFQRPTLTPSFGDAVTMYGRTLEECFIYQNIDTFKEGKLTCGITIADDPEKVRDDVYELIKSSTFKKTEFALDIASSSEDWITPDYIANGLSWLQGKLGTSQTAGEI